MGEAPAFRKELIGVRTHETVLRAGFFQQESAKILFLHKNILRRWEKFLLFIAKKLRLMNLFRNITHNSPDQQLWKG